MVERIVSPTVQRAQRIPPGQHEVKDFPVLDLGVHPEFDEASWRLKIWGQVQAPLEFSWAEFRSLPRVGLTADFHCVTKWSRLDLEWEGVAFATIAEKVRPKPTAKAVMAHGMEGYTTNVLLADLMDRDVILADTLEGKPLTKEHGGPLRLLVPKLYAWKSCKFLNGLEFLGADEPGFWEQRGYHMRGDYWKEQRFW